MIIINGKCRSCGERDEMINDIMSENSKLAPRKYKVRNDWVDKVIHRELCKKLKFDHMNKWYMHNLESVPENEIPKLLCDFEIQTDHQILARRLDLEIVKKKKQTLPNSRLCFSGRLRSKIFKKARREVNI